MKIENVCVFCASSRKAPEKWLSLARQVGAGLARMGIGVVYGGASIGMMGALADAAMAEGGRVTGVIPKWLRIKEVAHEGLARLVVTDDMHRRKTAMYDMSDVFVVAPGGLGTLEEALEIITWKQLGIHTKPVFLLNPEGYFDDLLAQFEKCSEQMLMDRRSFGLWKTAASPDELLDHIKFLNFQA
ncbi:MAG: TIGR00730 family Rossman fold protein [Nitrospinota bacterium]|nr:TIGR00730 family Rossman fold protein [Nitrospinota bacterium]